MKSLWLVGCMISVVSGLGYCGSSSDVLSDALPSASTLVLLAIGLTIVGFFGKPFAKH